MGVRIVGLKSVREVEGDLSASMSRVHESSSSRKKATRGATDPRLVMHGGWRSTADPVIRAPVRDVGLQRNWES